MRWAFILLFLIGVTGAAGAQTPSPPLDGFGDYKFGEQINDVRARGHGHWTQSDIDGGLVALSGGEQIVLGGLTFDEVLIFQQDRLRRIMLVNQVQAPDLAACEDALTTLTHLVEGVYGPLDSDAPGWEQAVVTHQLRTEGGSIVRFRQGETGALGQGSADRIWPQLFVQTYARADPHGEGAACNLSVAFDPLAYTGPLPLRLGLLPAPTAEELEAAGPVMETGEMFWFRRPTGRDFAQHYPDEALSHHVGGRVVLDCIIRADGRPACRVQSETPPHYGFAEAARNIAIPFQTLPFINGRAIEGRRVLIPITFRLGN